MQFQCISVRNQFCPWSGEEVIQLSDCYITVSRNWSDNATCPDLLPVSEYSDLNFGSKNKIDEHLGALSILLQNYCVVLFVVRNNLHISLIWSSHCEDEAGSKSIFKLHTVQYKCCVPASLLQLETFACKIPNHVMRNSPIKWVCVRRV